MACVRFALIPVLVVALAVVSSTSAATFGEDPVARFAVYRRGGRQAADDGVAAATPVAKSPVEDAVADAFPVLDDDDLARKKKKNVTVGEEVLTAIVDGITGESPDAKFGSEIRDQFVTLVEAVFQFGAAASTELANEGGASRTAAAPVTPADCGGDNKCDEQAKASRRARAVDNVGEGRRRQVRRLLVRYLVLLKVFALGIILPGAVLLSLVQSWKAVTLSLMALLLAGVIGLRGLVTTAAKGQTAEVIHTTAPGGHYWKRVSSQDAGLEPDRLAYGAYVPLR